MNAILPIEAGEIIEAAPALAAQTVLRPEQFRPIGQLTKAIAGVMKDVDVVAKHGENSFHRYRYAKMEDILKEITPLLGRHGLVIFQSETGRAMFDNDNVIAIEYAFAVAHESGETWPHQLRQTGVSRCRDSKGGWDDKSLNKCHTAARKYFLLSLFQIPTGDEADADKGENNRAHDRPKTLAKKDAKDIYTKLQAELDANASRRELNEWGEANAERIRLLPEDWQQTLRLRYQEHMLDLQNREHKPEHDADGVVWEEHGERPATKADNDDGLDIPTALRRLKPEPSLKERLLADIPALASPQDILHWSLAMSRQADVLPKPDQDEIGAALQARQKIILMNGSAGGAHH